MEAKQQTHSRTHARTHLATHLHIGKFIITVHGKALLTSYQDRKPEKASHFNLPATEWLQDLKQGLVIYTTQLLQYDKTL